MEADMSNCDRKTCKLSGDSMPECDKGDKATERETPKQAYVIQQLPGGLCFAHGRYSGYQCPEWPNCVNDPQKPEYLAQAGNWSNRTEPDFAGVAEFHNAANADSHSVPSPSGMSAEQFIEAKLVPPLLREERDALAEQLENRLNALDKMTEERDALKKIADRCGKENCMGQFVEGCRSWVAKERWEKERERAERAEAALAEARNKALDEARHEITLWCLRRGTGARLANSMDDAILALKSKPELSEGER